MVLLLSYYNISWVSFHASNAELLNSFNRCIIFNNMNNLYNHPPIDECLKCLVFHYREQSYNENLCRYLSHLCYYILKIEFQKWDKGTFRQSSLPYTVCIPQKQCVQFLLFESVFSRFL